jgi:hypothetical protein
MSIDKISTELAGNDAQRGFNPLVTIAGLFVKKEKLQEIKPKNVEALLNPKTVVTPPTDVRPKSTELPPREVSPTLTKAEMLRDARNTGAKIHVGTSAELPHLNVDVNGNSQPLSAEPNPDNIETREAAIEQITITPQVMKEPFKRNEDSDEFAVVADNLSKNEKGVSAMF